MNRYIDADVMIARASQDSERMYLESVARHIPSIDIVWCKECKHRPIKEDPNGENYGFNLIEPKDGNKRCPCLIEDGWYSWMPKDDFYCGFGEREDK